MCVRACVRACVRVCVCVYLFVCPVRESSGCLTAAARAALPIPTSECIHCQCLDLFFFPPSAQILLHAIAHAGCTDTAGESALKTDSGRNIPCHIRDSNPRQYYACRGFSVRRSTH